MTIKRKFVKTLSATGLMLAASLASAELVVVVNANSPLDKVEQNDLQQVFLGKRSDIAGTDVVAIDQAEGSAIRDDFYDKIIEKSAAQLNAYWSRLIFTGRGKPPKQYFDDAEVVEVILEDDESIGYIDSASITEGIKVIYTVK